jgi:hypothetical protein
MGKKRKSGSTGIELDDYFAAGPINAVGPDFALKSWLRKAHVLLAPIMGA